MSDGERTMMPKIRWPRWMHCLYAFCAGYYWLPCPLCGRKRGGHEPSGRLMLTWHSGVMVCESCAARADGLNRDFMRENPAPPVLLQGR